jgi:hypothetical protein
MRDFRIIFGAFGIERKFALFRAFLNSVVHLSDYWSCIWLSSIVSCRESITDVGAGDRFASDVMAAAVGFCGPDHISVMVDVSDGLVRSATDEPRTKVRAGAGGGRLDPGM